MRTLLVPDSVLALTTIPALLMWQSLTEEGFDLEREIFYEHLPEEQATLLAQWEPDTVPDAIPATRLRAAAALKQALRRLA